MLREVDTDLWAIETPFQIVGLDMGARMTIVRRKNGTLFVYAPFAVSEEDAVAIRDRGEVRDIVAPNVAHYTEIGAFAERFPDATLWTLPEIDKRLGDTPHQHLEGAPDEWKEDFDCLLVDGLYHFREWVFCHRASRTLIVTDLGYHLAPAQTPLGRMATRLNGISRRFGTSRFERNLVRLGDKAKVRQHIHTILGWEFDRIVPGHGFIEEGHAQQKLRMAYRFLKV